MSSSDNNAASAAGATGSSSDNNNNNTKNDELVSNFMAFTGSSDPARANSYLEMCGGDLQTAVGLYLEHEHGGSESMLGGGGAGGGGGIGTGSSRTGSAASSTGAVGGGGGGGSDGSLGRGLLGDDDWDVRAPDATQTMRLMDDPPHHHMLMSADPTYQLMHAMMDEQLAQSAFASSPQPAPLATRRLDVRAAINAAERAASLRLARHHDIDIDNDDSDQEYNYDDQDGDDASNGGKHDDEDDDDDVQIVPSGPVAPRLSDMFAAPTHLIHKAGGFAGARASAKDSKRWLLVNIQRDAEFSSHALNRDVWRDELVENLIREGFIFWQAMDQSTEGRTFVERYTVHDYPHISIIDPRTGRLLWRKEGWTQQNPVTAETFAEMAMDFCSRNSLDRPPQAPRPPGTSGGGTGSGAAAGAARPAQKRPVQEMTEDEQLQAAMRASMDDLTKTGTIDVDDDDDANGDDDEVQVVEGMEVEEDGKPAARKKATPSLVDELLSMTVPAEPSTGGARIQLRMPDGKREVRKFAGSDVVKVVYAFVALSNDEARGGRDFSLLAGFPPSDLIFDLDRTIDDCKLAGQTVTVRWKEG